MFIPVYTVLIVLLFRGISALTPVTNDVYESAGKCTLQIAKRYFTTNSPNINVFLLNSSLDGDALLSLVYHSPDHAKTLRDLTKYKFNYTHVKRRFAIVVTDSLEELLLYRHQFSELNLWNARARYIFIIRNNSIKSLNQVVKLLWYNYIINGLIMMPSRTNQSVQDIYSWFPYENGLCGGNFTARIVDVCEYGQFKEDVDLFPPKVPDVVNNCPVRARIIIWTPFIMPPDDDNIVDNTPLNITQGFDIRILKTAAQHMNINAMIMSSTTKNNWGIASMDGNATGNIKSLMSKEIDMSFGGYGPMLERRVYCDFSTSLYFEAITWCVPRAQYAARWRNVIDIFTYNTWFALVATYFLVSVIIWYVCNWEPKDATSYVKLHDSLTALFAICLAVSCPKIPNKFSSRIIFFIWVFFSMNIGAAYQAKLISAFLNPSYDAQVNTLEGILTSGLDWAAMPSAKRFFGDTDDWRVRYVLRDWQPCLDVNECLHRVAHQRDFAVFITKIHAKYETLSYLDKNSQSKIFCFPDEYLKFPSEMYMVKGFPFRDRLNTLIMRMQAAGLIPKWQGDYDYKQFIHQMKLLNDKHPDDLEPKLTVQHLQGAFLLLLFGLLFAFLSFIGEQTVHNTLHRTQIRMMKQKQNRL